MHSIRLEAKQDRSHVNDFKFIDLVFAQDVEPYLDKCVLQSSLAFLAYWMMRLRFSTLTPL
jgi:hypothetical protein